MTHSASSLIPHSSSLLDDVSLTRRALELAAQGTGRVSPSPLVGCVITDANNNIVGEGYYLYENTTHAEVIALRNAGERARGGTAYVSLEPHCYHGRTPPCTDALVRAGIKKVVAPIRDPNPLVDGKGFEILRAREVEVVVGLLADEAARQNEKYICAMRHRRPFVHLKMATSLDGKIAFAGGELNVEKTTPCENPSYLSNAESRARVHTLRHEYDAIVIGANTLRHDNPRLTDRSHQPRRRPLVRVVVTHNLDLPCDAHLLASASQTNPVLLIADDTAPNRLYAQQLNGRECETELIASTDDVPQILNALYRRSLHSVLLEGGATLASSFMRAQLVDKVSFFVAPLLIGNRRHAPSALNDIPLTRLYNPTHQTHGADVEVTGYTKQDVTDMIASGDL